MKSLARSFAFVLVFLWVSPVQSQVRSDLKAFIDTVLHQAKKSSLNAHYVGWDSVRSGFYKHAADAKTVNDLKPGFELLLTALNDPHAKIINATDHSVVAALDSRKNSDQNSTVVVTPEKINTQFEFRELENGIGYLRIAGVSPKADLQKEAERIRIAIDSLAKRESQRWIIDLRYHSDGQFHPVMAGLAPLLGEGQVCGVVNNRNRITKLYEVHNGNFYDEQKRIGKFANLTHDVEPKIAVLISRNTSGPGQVVAISLKGRKNTKFFGEPTSGAVTITKQIPVGKNLIMSISESVYQDRIGTPYHFNVEPDHQVAYVAPVASSAADQGINEALSWLNEEIISSVRE